MRKLAQLVADRTTIRVEADYTTQGRGTTWYLQWSNGPTVATMREHTRAAARAVPDLDPAEVGYQRTYDDQGGRCCLTSTGPRRTVPPGGGGCWAHRRPREVC
jgi:hypothetical protein